MMSTVSGAAQGRVVEDEQAIAEIMHRGGRVLRERMALTEQHLERVAQEAGSPLAAHATATVLAGGKRLRPLLVVLAASAAAEDAGGAGAEARELTAEDGKRAAEAGELTAVEDGKRAGAEEHEHRLVRAAVAVELVHSATLVHDDVLDGAQLRRGHPSVVAQAGRRAAIATGDLLFSRAFAELARNGSLAQLRALSDASSALATGELLQREDAYAARVAVDRYLHRCELKTAALFEAACRLGALVAMGGDEGASAAEALEGRAPAAEASASADEGRVSERGEPALAQELADALGAFARRIGLAFQLLDDVLDVSGPVERTGKPRGTDLLDGTVTLPLILARERDERLASCDLASLAGPEQADELCDRIAATGALEEARERALTLVAEAKAMLPAILPNGRAGLLDLVADAVVERYR